MAEPGQYQSPERRPPAETANVVSDQKEIVIEKPDNLTDEQWQDLSAKFDKKQKAEASKAVKDREERIFQEGVEQGKKDAEGSNAELERTRKDLAQARQDAQESEKAAREAYTIGYDEAKLKFGGTPDEKEAARLEDAKKDAKEEWNKELEQERQALEAAKKDFEDERKRVEDDAYFQGRWERQQEVDKEKRRWKRRRVQQRTARATKLMNSFHVFSPSETKTAPPSKNDRSTAKERWEATLEYEREKRENRSLACYAYCDLREATKLLFEGLQDCNGINTIVKLTPEEIEKLRDPDCDKAGFEAVTRRIMKYSKDSGGPEWSDPLPDNARRGDTNKTYGWGCNELIAFHHKTAFERPPKFLTDERQWHDCHTNFYSICQCKNLASAASLIFLGEELKPLDSIQTSMPFKAVLEPLLDLLCEYLNFKKHPWKLEEVVQVNPKSWRIQIREKFSTIKPGELYSVECMLDLYKKSGKSFKDHQGAIYQCRAGLNFNFALNAVRVFQTFAKEVRGAPNIFLTDYEKWARLVHKMEEFALYGNKTAEQLSKWTVEMAKANKQRAEAAKGDNDSDVDDADIEEIVENETVTDDMGNDLPYLKL